MAVMIPGYTRNISTICELAFPLPQQLHAIVGRDAQWLGVSIPCWGFLSGGVFFARLSIGVLCCSAKITRACKRARVLNNTSGGNRCTHMAVQCHNLYWSSRDKSLSGHKARY